jgi:hypothetical protein
MDRQLDIINNICSYNFKDITNLYIDNFLFLNNIINYIMNNKKKIEALYSNNIFNVKSINNELVFLLDNYLNPKLYKHINHIYNLISITNMYSKKYNMNIYLFGDIHISEYECKNLKNSDNISNFLDNQIKTATVPLDIFIEGKIYSKAKKEFININNSELYLNKFQKDYIDCLTHDKEKCLPYIRVHSIDYRKLDYSIFGILNYFLSISYILDDKDFYEKYNDNIDIHLNYINELLDNKTSNALSSKENLIKFFDDIINKTKIKNQLDNISDIDIYNKIIEYSYKNWLIKEINNNYNYINEIKSFIEKYKKYKESNGTWLFSDNKNKLFIQLKKIVSGLINITSYVMDLYLISRLFRSYNYKKYKYSGRAKNIIIYTGNWHIEKYIDILNYIGSFDIKYNKTHMRDNKYCIDIKDLKQPLFVI